MSDGLPEGRYANLFTVGYNAFEFVVDCAQLYPEEPEPHVHSRIVTSPTYAKLLLETLSESLARYEQSYGAIPGPDRGAGGETRSDDGRTTMPERPDPPKPGDYSRQSEPPASPPAPPTPPTPPRGGYTRPYSGPGQGPGKYGQPGPGHEHPGHEHPGHEHPGHEHPHEDPGGQYGEEQPYEPGTPSGYTDPGDTGYEPPPKQGYEPPKQGYEPPKQGYEPPKQGYEPTPTQGYEPPKQGYEPTPTQGYETPGKPGYDPQRTPPPDDKPCPKPEEQLKELQKALDTQNTQIQSLEKQRKSLEEDLTGLKQTVDELAKILAAYKEACKKLKQQKAELEVTVQTKTPMVEAGVGERKPLIEKCIEGVDSWIKQWTQYADYLEPKAKAAADAATKAAEGATTAQTSYDDLKNSAKTLDEQLKALAALRDKIEQEDDENKVCRMYFLLKELKAGLAGVKLRTLEELERELCLAWTELNKAKEAARAARIAADIARARADRAKTKAAEAKGTRSDLILECVDKVCPAPPPADGCC